MKYRRKTEKEISKLKKLQHDRSFNPIEPFLISIMTILCTFILSSYVQRFGSNQTPPGPSFELLRLSVIAGIVIFIFYYFKQIVTRRPLDDGNYFGICNKCQKIEVYGNIKCHCGGKFEPKYFYKLIDRKNRKQQ